MSSESQISHDPSTLFFQTDYVRRSILSAYWLIIVLALPLWWHTTSIARLSLPSSRVKEQTQHHLRIPISIGLDTGSDGRSLAPQLQKSFDKIIQDSPPRWDGLHIQINDSPIKGSDIDGSYTVVNSRDVAVQGRQLAFPTEEINALVETLSSLVAPSASTSEQEHRVTQYSPRYRLSFTLLNEDAAAGSSFTEWDVSVAITDHISPILSKLSVLHNFTLESQVQFHAPLAFAPRSVGGGFGIDPEDLTVFVNSAEWTLSSSASNDPVLHFIIFVPSASHRPLHILNTQGTISSSTSFLLPQWGSILILNPEESIPQPRLSEVSLAPVFSTFSKHLLALLGVAKLPPGVKEAITDNSTLTDWQLDALLRYRTLSNTQGSKNTLSSIINLANQIENMPIGYDVKGDIHGALVALEQISVLSKTSLTEIFRLSAHAFTLSSRAFFNPGMLALLYFPAEHKYAVYTPMFASAMIPLFVAALREFAAWKKQRKERKLNAESDAHLND